MNLKNKENLNKILNILIIIAIFIILGIIVHKFFNASAGADKYQKGLELYNQKDYQNAYYNFVRVPKNSKYHNLSLFRQGMCAEKLGDNNIQAEKYEEFAQKYNNSLTAEAAFKSGLAYFYDKKYANAQKMFNKAVKISAGADNKISNYSIAANYYLAQIAEDKNPQDAIKYYLQYLQQITDGRYSKNSAIAVDKLLTQNPNIKISEDEAFYIANTFLINKDFPKAQIYFDKTNNAKYWYKKAENYSALNNTQKTLEMLNFGLTQYTDGVSSKDLSDAINLYVKVASPDKQANWKALYDNLKDKNFNGKDEIFYNLNLYQEIFDKNLKGEYAQKAVENLFFNAYKKREYNLARSYGTAYLDRYPDSKTAPKILYHLGKIYEKLYKKLEASQLYNRLTVNYPSSFWAYRAYCQNKKGKNQFAKLTSLAYLPIDINKRIPQFPYDEILLNKNDAKFLNLLIEIKDYDLIEKISPENLAVKSWSNYKSGNFSLSVVQARDYLNSLDTKPDFQNDLYTLAYPIMYKDEINQQAKINNLDAFLIESLIREESYFNPKAQSSVGALGLMQLMPQTANFIQNQKVSKEQLLNPEYNIMLGTKYYNYIKRTLNNNNVYAVLAYNGGPGAVQNWLKTNNSEDIDNFIENVPFDETQNYVFKVYRTYWNYLNIYKPNKL